MRIQEGVRCAFISGIALWCAAQTPKVPVAPAPSGVVTGHVVCADTQRPGRFAEVALLRKPDNTTHPIAPEKGKSATESKSTSRSAPQVVYASGWSGLDGSYVIRHVPPGDYFVIARMDGYIMPIARLARENDADDSLGKVLADTPVAHVVGDQTVQVDVTMRRGGAISGQVRFDDGMPVLAAVVMVEPADGVDPVPYISLAQLTEIVGRRYQGMTDDEGRYRIAGLEPGKYRVFTMIPLERETWITSYGSSGAQQYGRNSPGSSGKPSELTVYQPGTFRPSEAKVFEIKGDERDADADIEVPVDGLHSIQGRLLAKSDGHVPNFAVVNVFIEGEFGRIARVSVDGSFRMNYLPKGTYTVTTQASDNETVSSGQTGVPRELRRYERMTTTVVIGEHDLVLDDLLVVEAKSEP